MEKLEFDILSAAATGRNAGSNKSLNYYPEETVALAVAKLKSNGFLDKNGITGKGLCYLKPYKVKRAVFLAAGFGSRMVPITLNTPKPLVRVHGKRIIETLIDAVIAAGIEEIYIVHGYLGEQFELLRKKYPMIQLIANPEYDGTGTISSFYYARNLLENAYVLESDLVVQNPGVIKKYHYTSDFLGTKTKETEDWFFKTEDGGTISEIGIGGSGDNCYRLIGISYWNGTDGNNLARDIQEAYESPEGKNLPMSYVPFRVYKDKYKISIMPCEKSDVIEIDTFAELQMFDSAYKVS